MSNVTSTDTNYLKISKYLHAVGAGAAALALYLANGGFAQAAFVSGGIAVVANVAGIAIAS
jgi:hypothetical protein